MPGPDLPEVPAPLKGIQHYLKIASEHDQRDPVVSYWGMNSHNLFQYDVKKKQPKCYF